MKIYCRVRDKVEGGGGRGFEDNSKIPFGLGQAEGHSSHTEISTLAKSFTVKERVKCKVPLATRLQKRPVKIRMYLGLDSRIKLKFTTKGQCQ